MNIAENTALVQENVHHTALVIIRAALSGNAVGRVLRQPLFFQLRFCPLPLPIPVQFLVEHGLKAPALILQSPVQPGLQRLLVHAVRQTGEEGNPSVLVNPLGEVLQQPAVRLPYGNGEKRGAVSGI